MPAYFQQGFMVRQPAWHKLGTVLEDYPGREEAMDLAGHNFEVVERDLFGRTIDNDGQEIYKALTKRNKDTGEIQGGWKQLVKSMPGDKTDGQLFNIAKASYGVIQNSVGWDIVDAIVGEGAKYETGITIGDGSTCSVLAWLPEPTVIDGDNSEILPWVNVSWTHDGTGSLRARPTSIRTVCWNTQTAAEAQGKRTGTEFTFRHSKNVMQNIEQAKETIKGMRIYHQEYIEIAQELAKVAISDAQREIFISEFIPMPEIKADVLMTQRVVRNVDEARNKLRGLFNGDSIPEAHRNTGYGLHLAGGEYLDHVRNFRAQHTYFNRCMMHHDAGKKALTKLIREVAVA